MRRLAGVTLLAALAAPAAAGDIIYLNDGRTVGAPRAADPPGAAEFAASSIVVAEENTDTIVYKLPGIAQRQSVPRAQVRTVAHDPASVPPELAAGIDLVARGQFDEGRAKLSALSRNTAAPAWAQAEAAFRHAASFAAQGNSLGAERALATFARERTRSRHVIDARRLRARLLCDAGRDDEAKSEYEQIARVAGVTDDEALTARFLSAWIDARAALSSAEPARLAAAAKPFGEIRAKSPAIAPRCDVAVAALNGGTGAIAALLPESADPFVLAVGGTIVADAARARGLEKKDRAELEAALERYLRVVLLHRDAEGAAWFTAKAQFHAGELFAELAGGAAEGRSRARREWEELVRLSPRSEWARRARAALAALE